ncbi:MAG TPA: ABC transporter ATP-binding protein [Oscillatoriaceae cyanobacterium]
MSAPTITEPAARQGAQEVMRVEQVSKTYPGRYGRAPVEAVRGVSFSLSRGEVLALLGPNGAGKTTVIKMISGLLRPSSGRILLGDVDVAQSRSKAVRHLGAILEGNRNLHWKLTAWENLLYFGALKGVRKLKERAQELIDQLELGAHSQKRVGELSRGLQQRVAIAIALLNTPEVLLLDEPTLGLDVEAAYNFKQVVRGIAREGCAIVLTTHQMEVAQELSNRVAIVAGGQLAVSESMAQLLDTYRNPGYEIKVRGALDAASHPQLAVWGAECFHSEDGVSGFALPAGHKDDLFAALDALRGLGVELLSVTPREINLEEVYLRVVRAQ